MILLDDFYAYFDNFKNRVDVKHVLYLTHEEEVTSLKEMDKNIMLVVLPSAIPDSKNIDARIDNNASFLFLMQKKDESNINNAVSRTMFGDTQAVILDIRNKIYADALDQNGACHFMHKLSVDSLVIDPIGYYHGWRGWSMGLRFKK